MQSLPIHELGSQVMIITDNNSTFLDWLRAAISRLPEAGEKFYTLHHCCPAIYWEHGGPSQEARQEARLAWNAEESSLARATHYFTHVTTLLREFGVPADHIRTHLSVEEDDPIKAVVDELERGKYSGVILSGYHHDLVRRLQGRGLRGLFRHHLDVVVWALDETALGFAHPV
jgi:hypothetical protein